LKKHGFRWSPKNKAWQRQLTENARFTVRHYLLAKLGGEIKAAQEEPKKEIELEIEEKKDTFVAKIVSPLSLTDSKKLIAKAQKFNAKVVGKTFTFATKKDLDNFVKPSAAQEESLYITTQEMNKNVVENLVKFSTNLTLSNYTQIENKLLKKGAFLQDDILRYDNKFYIEVLYLKNEGEDGYYRIAQKKGEAAFLEGSITKKSIAKNMFIESIQPKKSDDIELIHLHDIHINKKLFQNRADDFSQESVNRIVKAVENKTFNWKMLDPILLWRNPKDKNLYVLSGHSRTEAFIRLAKKGVDYEGRDFTYIPAKIIQATQEEAVQIALNSNTLSTKETDLERANYYRNLRKNGKTKKEILQLAQENEGKNAKKIFNLSFLNEKGEILTLLKNFSNSDTTNRATLEIVADWVGEAREKFPLLTNSHENELTKWLLETAYGTKTGQFTNKKAFFERLNVAIQKKTTFGVFEENTPLNMEKSVFKNSIEHEFDKETDELKKAVAEAEKELKKVSDNAYQLLKEGKTTQKRVNEVVAEKTKLFTVAKNKLQEHVLRKNDVLAQSKQQTSLFGVKSKKIMSARELSKKTFQEYDFKGKYLALMGKPSEGFRMMLHGRPGGGKTTFLLQFAKYLCNNFGNVLYVSKEEFGSSTLTQKINKYLKPIPHNIDFAENLQGIDLKGYNFVVLDSINDLGMDLKAFKELKAKYPKTAFILILQCTKAGTFKGGKEWEHEVEIGAEIKEAGVISVYKNRFDVKGELNFFGK
jgi:hypothetical protein